MSIRMDRGRWAAAAIGLAGLLAPAATLRADVTLPAIFGNHMVLQRDQKDPIWGIADPGEEVRVTIGDQTQSTTADDQGMWRVVLDPLAAGGPHVMTIEGKNKVTFDDVLVGEVWVCSGQSNMWWTVNLSNDPDLESLTADFPQIRLVTVPNRGTQEPQTDFDGQWKVCTPESARDFSAVGYFFGRTLNQALDVPVGLINDAWGGSACEAWINRELLEKDEKYGPLIERWKKIEADYPAAKAAYEKALAEWEKAAEAAKAEGKDAPAKPGNPDGRMNGNARPGNIYNGVLKPTIGYGIRGAIWYQGESNAGRAYQYRDLFPLMIQSWRDEWGQGDFPFYWVQLADFMAEKAEPAESDWAELREAQTMTMDRLPKTGEAVIIDIGEGKDIHPKNKQDVAKRLARWALAKDYGIEIAHQSPRFKSMEVKDGKAILTFDHVGPGLKTFDVQEALGFTVAGSDKTFHNATAKVIGKDQVEVSCPDVTEPTAVRYAWADNPVCNLYSGDGLPLTPFRTDDWPGATIDAK